MKKIVTLILMLCMVLSFTACADKESETPELTLQEIYDATNIPALLEKHFKENMRGVLF